LVTASREIVPDDRPHLEDGLREVVGDDPGAHTLVQGDALGGDQVFAAIARDWGWTVEAHPADWYAPCRETCKPGHRRTSHASGEQYCPAAGVYRNTHMVSLGADAAVAAYKRGAANKGTTHCAQAAGRAGIPVKRVVV
jgi:hypothetical protein